MKTLAGGRKATFWFLLLAATVLLLALGTDAFAQFGVPRPAASPGPDGIAGWLIAKQAEFYRQFSGLIRSAKSDGSAAWGLFGLSFVYGMFHAAGPGHGKAVISSYVVANEQTWRRGVVLSFASALLQALVAIALVGVAAALLNASHAPLDPAETRSRAAVTVSGSCRAIYSRIASAKRRLLERLSRLANLSTSSNSSSGTEIAVFIPEV